MRRCAILVFLVLESCMQRSEPSQAAASAAMLLPQQVDFTAGNQGENTWGYIDLAGTFLIKAQFEAAGPFSEDLASVSRLVGGWLQRKVAKYGYIKRSGEY